MTHKINTLMSLVVSELRDGNIPKEHLGSSKSLIGPNCIKGKLNPIKTSFFG